MANSLQTLLHEAHRAYFIGLQKKSPLSTADPFQPKLAAILDKRLSAKQRHLVAQSQVMCKQGLDAARKNDLVASARVFQEIEHFIHTERFSKEAELISLSFYEAAAAYFDYRNTAFDCAIARLYAALGYDLALEEIPDYALLQLHRIKLLLNILRIYVKRKAVQEALQLGVQIMNYLENKADGPSVSSSWDTLRLSTLPNEIKDLQFAETTGELATLMVGTDILATGQTVNQAFAAFALHIHSPDTDSCYLNTQAHIWLRAKQALLNEEREEFLSQALPLLSYGRVSFPQLWYAICIDLFGLCQQINLPEATTIKKDILAAAPLWPWKHFPLRWQTLLALPSDAQRHLQLSGT